MISPVQEKVRPGEDRINWGRIVNYLAGKVFARRYALARDEVHSLAGLAVAIARVRFDPARATCGLGAWACGCGWLQLQTLIRDELARRRRERAICFSDCLLSANTGKAAAGKSASGISAFAVDPHDALWSLQPDWLALLSAADRRLVQLRADGCTLQETAIRLGLTASAVRCGLKRIRRCLAQLEHHPAAAPGERNTS